jgi:hypothetical protein
MLLKIALEMIISPEKSLDLDLVANAIDGSESRRSLCLYLHYLVHKEKRCEGANCDGFPI